MIMYDVKDHLSINLLWNSQQNQILPMFSIRDESLRQELIGASKFGSESRATRWCHHEMALTLRNLQCLQSSKDLHRTLLGARKEFLSCSGVTRVTSELAPYSPTSHTTPTGKRSASTDLTFISPFTRRVSSDITTRICNSTKSATFVTMTTRLTHQHSICGIRDAADPLYWIYIEQKGYAAFHSRRESISGESLTFIRDSNPSPLENKLRVITTILGGLTLKEVKEREYTMRYDRALRHTNSVCLEIFRFIFAVTLPFVRSNSGDAQLAVLNDHIYARLETHMGIGKAKEG
ncbi:hypothetical protein TNCV_2797821 [Trichonephila clavipes]|nr:hypothetical protein TNCV_2797821 [Trichonephila clavipes]